MSSTSTHLSAGGYGVRQSSSPMPSPFSYSAPAQRASSGAREEHDDRVQERNESHSLQQPFSSRPGHGRTAQLSRISAYTPAHDLKSSLIPDDNSAGHLRQYLPHSHHDRPGLARSQSVLEPVNRSPLATRPEVHEKTVQEIAATWPRVAITMQNGVVFLIGDVLGRGQFGTVYRAIDAATGRIVAVKRISIAHKPQPEVDHMMQEVKLLRSLVSPFVVKYEGYCMDEQYVSIVMEYVENGSLQNTLRTFGCFNEELVASYTIKILQGLIYLHLMDVVHCDVKCANVLTTKKGDVKLSDFGIALNLAGQSTIKGIGVSGTPNWLAPEVISLRGTTKASDIWALGCTVLEMVTGKPPYNGQNAMNTMYSIVEDRHPPLPTSISSPLRTFLLSCFQKEPRARPTAQELMHHPWITQFWRSKSDSKSLTTQSAPLTETKPQQPRTIESIALDCCPIDAGSPQSEPLVPMLAPVVAEKKKMSHRPTSAPVQLSKEQIHKLVPATMPHIAVMIFHLHQVQCSICGGLLRKALHCQRCNILAHTKCLSASAISCIGHDDRDGRRQMKEPCLKRQSALAGTTVSPISRDKLALLPLTAEARRSWDQSRQGCKLM